MEIDTRILHKPLVQYSVLNKTSLHIMQGMRYMRSIHFPDQMHYLMYILGKNDNGLQILYYCLKKTQHRYFRHRMIVQQLESKGERNLVQHVFLLMKYHKSLWVYFSPMFITPIMIVYHPASIQIERFYLFHSRTWNN